MNLDLGFIYKKPTVKFSLFAFLMPFSTSVWFLIGGCLITTTLSLYLFGKTSCKDDPLKSLVACFYFGLACLFAQGPETYPRSLFSRAISTSWWFFTLMTLTLYTATLTSILTVNRSTLSIQSIEDLLNSETFQYAIEPGNSVQSLFEHSTYGPFQMMWNELTKRKKDSFLLEKDALKKVRNKDNFAFIGESPFLEYDVTFAPCNLELVVSRNSPKTGSGYAFAFAQNSTLVKIFSIETLKMLADGQMSAIHAKWFKTRSQCSDEKKLANIINTIDFDDIRGILFTFLAGVVVPFTLYGFKRIWDQTILNIRSRNAVRDENSLRTDYLETASQHACNASDNEILSGDQVEVSDSSAIGDQKTPSKSEQNDGDSSQCTSSWKFLNRNDLFPSVVGTIASRVRYKFKQQKQPKYYLHIFIFPQFSCIFQHLSSTSPLYSKKQLKTYTNSMSNKSNNLTIDVQKRSKIKYKCTFSTNFEWKTIIFSIF